MDRECRAIDGQASMTIASSASIAALSAALLGQIGDFPDGFAASAGPASPTPCKSRQDKAFFYLLTFGSVAFPRSVNR